MSSLLPPEKITRVDLQVGSLKAVLMAARKHDPKEGRQKERRHALDLPRHHKLNEITERLLGSMTSRKIIWRIGIEGGCTCRQNRSHHA